VAGGACIVSYMASERERFEESLRGWASDTQKLTGQRDLLVTHALELGITKHRIYVLTGISRTTIDRIIAKETGGPSVSRTRKLEDEAERLTRYAATGRLPVDAGVVAELAILIREAYDKGQAELRDLAKDELTLVHDDPEERQELEAFLRRLDSYGVPR
jgi:hypothetical protein